MASDLAEIDFDHGEDGCAYCGGSGFVACCFEEFACAEPEEGCDLCTRVCDVCRPAPPALTEGAN